MATIANRVYGSGATLSQNQNPETKQDVTLNYSRMRYISDEYVVPAADNLGAGAIINFFEIPESARILDMFLTHPGSMGVFTADIGWDASPGLDDAGVALEAADLNGFYAAVDLNVADAKVAYAATVAGFRKKFLGKVQVNLNNVSGTTTSAGLTILLEAYFVID
jgi:hypothetical protein